MNISSSINPFDVNVIEITKDKLSFHFINIEDYNDIFKEFGTLFKRRTNRFPEHFFIGDNPIDQGAGLNGQGFMISDGQAAFLDDPLEDLNAIIGKIDECLHIEPSYPIFWYNVIIGSMTDNMIPPTMLAMMMIIIGSIKVTSRVVAISAS